MHLQNHPLLHPILVFACIGSDIVGVSVAADCNLHPMECYYYFCSCILCFAIGLVCACAYWLARKNTWNNACVCVSCLSCSDSDTILSSKSRTFSTFYT